MFGLFVAVIKLGKKAKRRLPLQIYFTENLEVIDVEYRVGSQVLRMQSISVQHAFEKFRLGRTKPPSHMV